MNQQSQQPGQGRQPMIYRAPLCRESGCGRHTWSLYCPDHRDSKLAELEAADAASLSLSDKKLLNEFSHRENAETRRIGQRVQKALPEMFETPPTADEIETAADRYYFMSQYSEMVRRQMVIEVMENRTPSAEETASQITPVAYSGDVDDASAAEAASRIDPMGPTPGAAGKVASYLFNAARAARIARGETEDSVGTPLSMSQEDYGVERMENGATSDVTDEDYMADRVMEQGMAAAQEFKVRRQHEQQVKAAQQQAQQQFGAERMNGYDNTPTQVQGAQSNAWAGVVQPVQPAGQGQENLAETREFQPISEGLAREIMAHDPNPGQIPRTPKFINNTTGVVYDQNMQPIGSLRSPEQQQTDVARRQQEMQRASQAQRIPEGMVRQRDNRPADPDQHWQRNHPRQEPVEARRAPTADRYNDDDDGFYEEPRRKGGLLRGIGRGVAKAAGMGVDIGMSFREAKQEEDDKNMARLAMYRQDEANRAMIQMGRNSRGGGWL